VIEPDEYYNPKTRKIIHAPESWEADLTALYTQDQIEDFIVDVLAEIGQNYSEISDEARNGMQVFASRLLEHLKEKTDEVKD